MTTLKLKCDCGKFRIQTEDVSESIGRRMVCYCDDCQAFVKILNRPDVVDPFGGTEVVPIRPCKIKIVGGFEQLNCLRLRVKGMYRWHTKCCQTPIGSNPFNTYFFDFGLDSRRPPAFPFF